MNSSLTRREEFNIEEEESCPIAGCRVSELLTFGPLDPKAVGDALRKLDLTGMPVTRAPTKQRAGVVDVSVLFSRETGGDTDEEMFTEFERLDLNEERVTGVVRAQ